jgi:photosystem II stability/assembly factor-like uncharacterized protein
MPHRYATLAGNLLIACTLFAQWQPYNANIGQVRSITTNGTDILAVGYPAGVWRSTDDGLTWSPANNGLPVSGGNVFAQALGRNATHLFAGTESGIYRSTNGGTSWTAANGSLTASASVHANKFFHFGNTTFAVFTGTIAQGGGIHRTVTNGDTWLIGHSGMGSNLTVHHMIQVGGTLYAATSVGIYKSTDLGQQWTILPNTNYAVYSVAHSGGHLIAASALGYRYTTNEGGNWTNCTGTPSPVSDAELIVADGMVYAAAGGSAGILRSTDNGASFSPFSTGLSPIDAFAPEEFHLGLNRLFLGCNMDLYSIPANTSPLNSTAIAAIGPPHPSPFNDGFFVELPEGVRGNLVLWDAMGREAMHMPANGGRQRVPRAGLAVGAYVVVLDEPINGPRLLGRVVAE